MHKILTLLFNPSDNVALYSHDANSKKPIKELIGPADSLNVTKNYFCINPLIEPEMGRLTQNVASITNFMFESDSIGLDEQMKAWDAIKAHMPIRTIISSGGSSLHIIFSLANSLPPNNFMFKSLRSALLAEIKKIEPKLASSLDNLTDMVRLSRTDGAIRLDTGKEQQLLYTGPLMSELYIQKLMPKTVEQKKIKSEPINSNITSVKGLETYLRINIPYLHTFFCHAGMWAAPSGIYPEIFKNFLWLLEESNCPIDLAVELYNTKTVPKLLLSGYPQDKVLRPVEHAINYFTTKEAI